MTLIINCFGITQQLNDSSSPQCDFQTPPLDKEKDLVTQAQLASEIECGILEHLIQKSERVLQSYL